MPLLPVSSVHTKAWNNKLDVVGSTPARRRWQRNTHLHAGLDCVQAKRKAADSHLSQSAVGKRWRRESFTISHIRRNSRRAASGGSYSHRHATTLEWWPNPKRTKSHPRLPPSSLPDILGKKGRATSVTQQAQKPPQMQQLCQTHCIHHS